VADLAAASGPALARPVRAGVGEAAAAMAPLLRRLGRLAQLTPLDVEAVRDLAVLRRRFRPGAVLQTEGRPPAAQFLICGWASSQRVLRDGRRQIFDFVLPGEGFGFGPLAEGRARHAVVAVTAVETVEAGGFLEAVSRARPGGLRQAIQAGLLEEEARRLDHMIRLGRLTGYEKAAHFILEMQRRSGLAEGRSFPLPLTQETMADALGLSVVHLNRVLRQLRAAGVVEIRGGMALVHDPSALAATAVLAPGPGEVAAAAR